MLDHVDYVLSPSTFVTRSFLARGFRSEQIVHNVYPLELSCFHPPSSDRPRDRPLRVISTGSLSLRKGTPYLLEAFRIVLRHEPAAELWLTQSVSDHLLPILGQFTDLPINWSPSLPHSQLATRLRSADVFVLPSLEDGFARTVAEALACGLPVVTTPNTGASDLVHDEQIGAVVPICDSAKLAEAILQCWQRRKENDFKPVPFDTSSLSFATFAKEFLGQLDAREILTLRSQHPLP
jgi:glycosyltransferase involved in cell wall biosynthesis